MPDVATHKNMSTLSKAACYVSLLAAILASSAAAEQTAPESQALSEVSSAFFKEYCTQCHGSDTQEGNLRFDTISFDLSEIQTAELWERIFQQVQFSEMPPDDGDKHPPAAEREKFVSLIDDALSRHGRGVGLKEKLILPEYGNYVDHDLLFGDSIDEAPYTPARLWRRRPDIYSSIWGTRYGQQHRLSVKIGDPIKEGDKHAVQHGPHKGRKITYRYFAQERFANPFYEFVHHASGFTDYATIPADQASLETLLLNAETMAEILTTGIPVSIQTEVKTKDSRRGNNHGGFVGGDVTNRIDRRGVVPDVFKRVIKNDGSVAKEDFAAALAVAFDLFLRRSPSQDELDHYWTNVFQKNAEFGNKIALQSALVYITLSPEFVYRMEMGLGEPDEHGRRMLSPQELVYAIHYAFHNTAPFGAKPMEGKDVYAPTKEPLVNEAMTRARRFADTRDSLVVEQMRAGQLVTKADVERVVRMILERPERNMFPNHNRTIRATARPRVLQFFREYFGYHKAATVFKDVEKFAGREGFQQYHKHSPVRMMYDTDTLVLHVLDKDQHVLEELLTTDKVYVSYWKGSNDPKRVARAGGKKKYARTHDVQSYNLDPFEVPDAENQPYQLPKDQRCGVLTQPSWLVAHSGNFENDPVRRGKWIREKLLAGTVMDVPITVDARIPDGETKTLRERFHVVHENQCWRCHKKMNPLGMPFEAYNHVGRFRTSEKGKPVDTSGAIGHTGITELDGEVADVREMMERLARSPRVRQSFIRHAFRFWMGRNEMLSDAKTLKAMDKAYVESDGSFKEMLVSLLTSDSFLYRK